MSSRANALAPLRDVSERSRASGERLRSCAQQRMWWCAVGAPGSGAYGVAMRMPAGSRFRFGWGVRRGGFGRAGVVVVAVVVGWLCLLVAVAGAAVPSSVPSSTWVTNGPVSSVVASGDRVYIGGRFTYVGPNTGSGVLLDRRRGSPVAPFAKVNGSVLAVVSDGAGGYYLGGWFDRVGGVPRANLAHIDADGSVDPAWNPNPNSGVDAFAVSRSTVYVGGGFTSIGGQPRSSIAALDARTGRVSAWNPNANNNVSALAVSGSTVYAGGLFTKIGGRARHHVAALDTGSGRASAWNPNPNGHYAGVFALAVSGSTIYVGGYFTSIGGRPRHNIAALDARSGRASAWNPNANGPSTWNRNNNRRYAHVVALAVSGSTVYAGGYFTSIGGQPRNSIAALDARSGRASAWNPNANPNRRYAGVVALAVSRSTIYAGGEFTKIGGRARHNIAALDARSGRASAWNPNPNNGVHALAVSRSTIYAGGAFTSIGGLARNGIAALDARSGRASAWNPNPNNGRYAHVDALAVSGSTVYAGGYFTSIGGRRRHNIAALDARTGRASAWNPNASASNPNPNGSNAHVDALAVSGSTVYAAGYFTSIGGRPRHNIAALDARSGRASAWNPNANGPYADVFALAVSGSTVYAAGDFTKIGGQARRHIAALDTTGSGRASAWNPNPGGPYAFVFALAVSGSTVYAAGDFTSIGGQARNNIAALDTGSGRASAWNPNANGGVGTLAVSGSTIYAGGSFTSIGGQARNNIAALDTGSGLASAWNPNATGDIVGEGIPSVGAVVVSRSTVYAGGDFLTIGGDPQEGFAAFPLSG